MSDPKPKPIADPTGPVVGAFRKYAPALHRYVTRRIRQPKDAPDLTQDIFERFMQIPDKQAIRDPQAYLYSIAAHLCSEWQERDTRQPVTFDSSAVDEAANSIEHASPDDLVVRAGIEQDLRWSLSQLPPMHRAVVLLAKQEGLTHEEIAQKTGLGVGTVTSYVSEACAKVKLLLRKERS